MIFLHTPPPSTLFLVFFFNDTATTEIYTLSLHDALPIYRDAALDVELDNHVGTFVGHADVVVLVDAEDRKSTRLNSSHQIISYAVFCLKKKKTNATHAPPPHLPTSPPYTHTPQLSPIRQP